MYIHEYQAKDIFRAHGVAVLKGGVASSAEDAVAVAHTLVPEGAQTGIWVVKGQIHAGGRGKGGGVKVVKTLEGVRDEATRMLGMQLITPQTGSHGQTVRKVYIEQGCAIAREIYLSLLVDRTMGRVMVMASTEGGVDIEEVAAHTPEKIFKLAIDPVTGLLPWHGRRVAYALGLKGDQVKKCVAFLQAMYKVFIDYDCSIVEINPLVVTVDNDVIALDAKMNFDDNALFRHLDIEALRDESEEDPTERDAAQHQLSYIRLDGSIACLVNGAGLAMATMDIIKLHGEEPANFLDVGGGAPKERVEAAFRIILNDPNVKGILVNIFGGIMRCDIIAEGVIAAARAIGLKVPLVVRLAGTNVDLGKKMLAESGLDIIPADDLDDAAQKVVAAVRR